MARVFFLDVRGIRQHERAEIAGARGAEDAAAKTSGHEAGQIAAVVEVRMREDHGVDPGRIDRQRGPVAQAQLFEPLEEPAVDEHAVIAQVEQVLGAGDGARGAEKCQGCHGMTILDG